MAKDLTSYAVVLTLPPEIEKELDKLRDSYNKYVGYTIPPHITLKQPFKLKVDLSAVSEKLEAVANGAESFTLTPGGVEYFENSNNVAYVAIRSKKPVMDLHTAIFRSLRGLVEGEYTENEEYNLEKFTPHITIAEQIPDEVFHVIKNELADYRLDCNIKIDSFALFYQLGDNIWKPVTTFELFGK